MKSATVDFISHCQYEKKLSSKTLKFYGIDLTQFLNFLIQENLEQDVSMIDKIILRSYVQNLSSFKPKTIKRKIATLKAFFNFMEFEDIVIINPFRKVKFSLKEPKTLPTVMTLPEIKKIFQLAYSKIPSKKGTQYKRFESIRNIAIVETLFATGIRVSELSNLKRANVDLEDGYIKVYGKGSKERIIQICNTETILALKEYATLVQLHKGNTIDSFFINRQNKQLSDQSIRSIIKKLTEKIISNKHITPHVFRHSTATLLLEEGVDIKYIQAILGHSSIMTTQMYTHVNCDKLKAILTDKHPRKHFMMNT